MIFPDTQGIKLAESSISVRLIESGVSFRINHNHLGHVKIEIDLIFVFNAYKRQVFLSYLGNGINNRSGSCPSGKTGADME